MIYPTGRGTFSVIIPRLFLTALTGVKSCKRGAYLNDTSLPVFAMKLQVRTGLLGFKVMPSFNRHHIPSEDLDDLMKYIIALRKHSQPIEQATR